MRYIPALFVAVAVAVPPAPASAHPAHDPEATSAAKQTRQVKRLRQQVRDLRRSREYWRDRAWAAEDSMIDGLPAQLTVLAQRGKASEVHSNVFQPIRANWPCGGDVYQGEYSWSLSIDLEEIVFETEDIDCSG